MAINLWSAQGSLQGSDFKFVTMGKSISFSGVFPFKKKIFILASFFFLNTTITIAQQATWIWYPGDYEIWLGNKMQNRRTERGTFYPVFWKMDSHYPLVDFHKVFSLSNSEEVAIYAEG